MNLEHEFNGALTYETYVAMLGEHKVLHELHYKKFSLPQEISKAKYLQMDYRILVITEPWCGDSLALLPIVRKLTEVSQIWKIGVLLRDQNQGVMDHFLTNGSQAIPIFLFLDSRHELILKWGPRPRAAQQIFEDHREQIERGEIKKEDVIRKIRTFYAKDRGISAIKELHQNLLSMK